MGTEVAGAVSAAFSSGSKLKPAARIQQSLASKQKERATRNQKQPEASNSMEASTAACSSRSSSSRSRCSNSTEAVATSSKD